MSTKKNLRIYNNLPIPPHSFVWSVRRIDKTNAKRRKELTRDRFPRGRTPISKAGLEHDCYSGMGGGRLYNYGVVECIRPAHVRLNEIELVHFRVSREFKVSVLDESPW